MRRKDKITINAEAIKELPYEVCQLMDRMMGKGTQKPISPEEYSEMLSRILAYGSKNAVSIAIHLQQLAYTLEQNSNPQKHWEMLATYALLISQVKYDLTSEAISPENWFKLRLKDYDDHRNDIVNIINRLVKDLELCSIFLVK